MHGATIKIIYITFIARNQQHNSCRLRSCSALWCTSTSYI